MSGEPVNIQLGTKARMALACPDGVRLTLSMTMSAAEWRGLAAQLPDDGTNAGRLHKMIRELVDTMTRRITVDMETTGYSNASAAPCPCGATGPFHNLGCVAPGAAIRVA